MERFIDFFYSFIKEQKQIVGKGLAINTYKTYLNRTDNFEQYLIDTDQMELSATKVTVRTLRNYDMWLRASKGFCNDYIMRNMQLVGRMLNNAVEDGVISFNPIKFYKFKFDRTKRMHFLNLDQLKALKECELPTVDLERNRDIFLFGCYTGLAYCDMKNFSRENIIVGEDGDNWLQISRQKTKAVNDTLLPVLPGALEILEKYNYHLPISANGNMNFALKKISKIAKIGIPLSTHSGRKTFGNILVNDFGVDIKTVSIMMGHKSLNTTEAWYVDVRAKKIIRDMKEVRIAKF